MAFTLPTVSDFKSQFDRDFLFAVPAYGAALSLTVAAGVVTAVTVLDGGTGYENAPAIKLVDSVGSSGSGAVFVATVAGGNVIGVAISSGGTGYGQPTAIISGGAGDDSREDYVRDRDITRAIGDASLNVNQALFPDQASFSQAFGYYCAHCLVERLRAAGEGLRSQFNWLNQSKTVGDVSASYQIPKQILNDPFLALISQTTYGARYLEIITPFLRGNMFASFRRTLP